MPVRASAPTADNRVGALERAAHEGAVEELELAARETLAAALPFVGDLRRARVMESGRAIVASNRHTSPVHKDSRLKVC